MAVKRSYDSSRRLRQAAQTRAEVLEAARRLFSERGYPATTIEAVAAEAEVSPATVYSIFGSKRGLLAAFQELMHLEVDHEGRNRLFEAAVDPASQIAAAVQISLSFSHRHGDVLTALLSARGIDPDVDEFLERGLNQGHRGGWKRAVKRLVAEDALRPQLSEKEAGDIAAALTRHEVYRMLATEFGWSHDRIEHVLTEVVCRTLLTQFGGPASPVV